MGFDDPNAFFACRDVEAGEELTLDYWTRSVPFALHGSTGFPFGSNEASAGMVPCRCGSLRCRGRFYPSTSEFVELCRECPKPCTSSPPEESPCGAYLQQRGFDDETALVAALAHVGCRSRSLIAYLNALWSPKGLSATDGDPASAIVEWRASKAQFLVNLRYVYRRMAEVSIGET